MFKSGNEDDLETNRGQLIDKIKCIFARHLDIKKNKVWSCLFNDDYSFINTSSCTRYGDILTKICDHFFQHVNIAGLIVNNNSSYHNYILRNGGINTITTVPATI